eukprot:12618929-Alexandrium_andersonii.AAC.1
MQLRAALGAIGRLRPTAPKAASSCTIPHNPAFCGFRHCLTLPAARAEAQSARRFWGSEGAEAL